MLEISGVVQLVRLAGIPPPMTDDIINLICGTLEAVCQPSEEHRAPTDAFGGPLWDVTVPDAKRIVPFILDFARLGQSVRLSANDRQFATLRLLAQPVVTDIGLKVMVERSFFGGDVVTAATVVPFTHRKAEPLCSGGWTVFGPAEVIFDSSALLPRVTWQNGEAVFTWTTPPGIRTHSKGPLGLRQWITETRIQSIHVGEFKGRVVTERPLKTLLLPDAVWG